MRIYRVLAAVTLAAALGACGSSSSKGTSASTTAKDAVCAARASLQKSVKALADPSLLTEGKSAISAAVDDVKTDLDALGNAVQSDLEPDVDAVKSALNQLETSVRDLGSGSVGSGIEAVGTAITKVGSTTSDLVDSLRTRCPSS